MTAMMNAVAIRVRAHETAALPLHVETVTCYQAFLHLESEWSELVEAAGVNHPFLEHAWIRTWWECFGSDSSLHILILKEGDEIIGIAPLILTHVRMFWLPVRRLGFFYNAHVPRADFIIARRSEDAYQAIWDHLLSIQGSWDLLQLSQLGEEPGTLETIQGLASGRGLRSGVWLSGASPFVNLDSSWTQYCETLPAKHRSNLRNRFKRLKLTGSVELETISRTECLPEALEAGFQLEQAAWKREAGTAISSDPAVRRFYETFARRAAERGWLRLNFLNAGAQRIAFDYSLSSIGVKSSF